MNWTHLISEEGKCNGWIERTNYLDFGMAVAPEVERVVH